MLGLAHMIATVRPRIGRAAGVITMIGLAGPIFFQGLYWGGSHLTAPARQAAAALAVTCLISTGFISGHLEISAVAFACTSVALVPLGLRTLRAR